MSRSPTPADLQSQRRRFVAAAMLIGLFALALRLLYVFMATVEFPIRGDINQYVLYAWNLTHRGVFSTALPDAPIAMPDSYRGPGYPLFLSAMMRLAGHSDLPLRAGPDGHVALGYVMDTWMRLALIAQAVFGAATTLLTIAVARFWLTRRLALWVGLLVAFWPHLIAFTGALLSESLFAFILLLAFWLLCRAERALTIGWTAAAGVGWGLAYLVNPVVGFFPLLAAGVLALQSRKRLAVILGVCFALAPAAWALRNSVVEAGPGASQRVLQNLVQGSWPQYHAAYNSRSNNEISRQISAAIDQEVQDVEAKGLIGIAGVFERMSEDPAYYLLWYLFEKPYLLWDWRVRMGWGDIYFLPTEHSPFASIPVLVAIKQAYEWLNPLLFVLAAAATVGILFGKIFRLRTGAFAEHSLAMLLLYLTAVHVVLQAEPRYSIPYRPEEVLLSMTALMWLLRRFAAFRHLRKLRKSFLTAASHNDTKLSRGVLDGVRSSPEPQCTNT